MANILHMPRKGMNPAAFGSELTCPYCQGTKWKYIEKVSQFRFRYQCKACKKTVQYDTSNRPEHPYAREMKSNKFMDMIRKINKKI